MWVDVGRRQAPDLRAAGEKATWPVALGPLAPRPREASLQRHRELDLKTQRTESTRLAVLRCYLWLHPELTFISCPLHTKTTSWFKLVSPGAVCLLYLRCEHFKWAAGAWQQ